MALCIMQVNIQSWNKNKYLLELETSYNNVDIILINETNSENIKIKGYKTIFKHASNYSGVAIAVRNHIETTEIPIMDNNTLAIKIKTKLGPLAIITSYIPPRIDYIPIIEINKILNHNIPTLIAGDYNAHHSTFNNTTRSVKTDNRGRQLHNLIKHRNLTYLGPHFNTLKSQNKLGKPDIVISNYHFNIFQTCITEGKHIGSDHVPVIIKIQTQPFRTIKPVTYNTNKMNIDKYKNILKTTQFTNLHNKNIKDIDDTTEKIFTAITKATQETCPKNNIKTISTYKPTQHITEKLEQLQNAYYNYYCYGTPQIYTINYLKNQLIKLIQEHKTENWTNIVNIAYDNYGNPTKFWRQIKTLTSTGNKIKQSLKIKQKINNTQDINHGRTITKIITDPQEQAKLMSKTWQNIYKPNTENIYNNNNTNKIETWYENIKHKLTPNNTIDITSLDNNHPFMRPVATSEYKYAIKKQKKIKLQVLVVLR